MSQPQSVATVIALLDNATAIGAGTSVKRARLDTASFQLSGLTTSGAGAVEAVVEVSNDGGASWLTALTISILLSTTRTSDGAYIEPIPWALVRGRIVSISGTGARVSLLMGV